MSIQLKIIGVDHNEQLIAVREGDHFDVEHGERILLPQSIGIENFIRQDTNLVIDTPEGQFTVNHFFNDSSTNPDAFVRDNLSTQVFDTKISSKDGDFTSTELGGRLSITLMTFDQHAQPISELLVAEGAVVNLPENVYSVKVDPIDLSTEHHQYDLVIGEQTPPLVIKNFFAEAAEHQAVNGEFIGRTHIGVEEKSISHNEADEALLIADQQETQNPAVSAVAVAATGASLFEAQEVHAAIYKNEYNITFKTDKLEAIIQKLIHARETYTPQHSALNQNRFEKILKLPEQAAPILAAIDNALSAHLPPGLLAKLLGAKPSDVAKGVRDASQEAADGERTPEDDNEAASTIETIESTTDETGAEDASSPGKSNKALPEQASAKAKAAKFKSKSEDEDDPSEVAADNENTAPPPNAAPTLGSGSLSSINEDTASPSGETVANIFAGQFADSNSNGTFSGVAVIADRSNGAGISEGNWQYSSNGTDWANIGSVADNSTALVIETSSYIRFVPSSNFQGTPGALSVRGLDNTYSGNFSTTAGGETRVTVDASLNGGTTAIAASAANLSTSINNINDAPTLGNGSLATITEDASSPSGQTVSTIFSGQFTDIDPSSSFAGVAIVANTANSGTEGAWQYSTNGGSNWFDIGVVADNSSALALSSSTLIRFVPVANFNGTPTALSVRAIDNTYAGSYSTTSGSETRITVDSSNNGGSTAIAGSSTSLSTSITALNDAPTLGDASLAAVNEDTSSPSGASVSTIFSGQFSDLDSGSSFGGIAIVGNTANSGTEGAWQYSTNGGSNWSDIGTVADNSTALALSASTLIRFVPVANFQGTPTALSVRAIDDTYASGYSSTGASETRVTIDSSSNGGTTAIEGSITTLSTSITNVNDAPTLGNGTLGAVNEDTASPAGATVSTVFNGQFSDIDPGSSFGGIAVIANSGNASQGTWQYSSNGSNWSDIGTVADNSTALAISASSYLRFVPANDYQGTPTGLTVRGLDNTYSGGYSTTVSSETRVTVDASANGGTSAITSTGASVSTSITNVNDAPTLGDGSLSAVNEDTSSPSGETISTIFSGQFSDIDPSSSFGGIAVVANSANSGTEGAWQYSTNSGSNWFDIGTVADNSTALALSASTLIRFVPVADFQGTPTALSVRGLDNTYAGGYSTTAGSETRVNVDTSTNGGTTAIEGSTSTLSTSITNVNDAPTLGDGSLSAINEDTASPSGELITTIFSGQFSDIDPSSSFGGIAVVGNSANAGTEGSWQYSSDSGATWANIATVADNDTALAIASTSYLRFVPVADFQGTPTALTVRGLDNTYGGSYSTSGGIMGESRAMVDTSTNGGTTAIEGSTTTISTSITNVNDAPTLGDGSLSAVNEDTSSPSGETVSTIFSGQFSDIDPSSSFGGIAVVANSANSGTEGAWQYSTNSGSNWFDIGTVADNSTALALSASTLIRFVPVADYQGVPTALTVRGLDNTYAGGYSTTADIETRVNVDTSSNGGTTAIEGSTTTLSTSITNVNDAPTLGDGSLSAVNEDTASPSGETVSTIFSGQFSDIDPGSSFGGIAVVGNTADPDTEGAWQYSSDSGSTWVNIGSVADNSTALAIEASSLIRFVPIANFQGTPTALTVRGLDNTYAGGYSTTSGGETRVNVDTSSNGGTTAIEGSTTSLSTSITNVNDAPTLGDGSLSAVNEDTSSPSGETVSTIFSGQFSDIDPSSSFGGIAVVANSANSGTEGAWQYSTNSGSNWFDIGTVADNSTALALSASTLIRFVPVADFQGTPTALSVRGLDNTYSSGYSTTTDSETRVNIDTATNGGTTAIEGSTTSLSTSITNVNDAPTLGDGSLSAVNEDTSSPSGEAISTIFSGQFSDIDPSSSFGGIAVVANSANSGTEGAWQYSTNSGSNWFDIGTVADNSTALALSASTLIRFVPVADYQGTPTALSVRGLDNTYSSGYSSTGASETRVNMDTSSNGGTTAIEGSTTTLSTSITNVNDAPTLGDGSLSAVNEDTASPSGETVSTIFSGQFSDIDPGSSFGGIAVVGNTADPDTEGAWQYSSDSGSTWVNIGSVADNSTALAIEASSLIRFVPIANFQGTPTALTVRGLDNTYAGGYSTTSGGETRVNVDTSSNGGTTAIEGSTTSLSTSITNVNDAPTLGDGSLSAVNEDTASPSGETVSTIFSGQFSDIDPSSSFGGIAVVANTANSGTEGAWQYSTNSGSNWFDIGAVADNSTALALSASTLIRFVPVADFQGTPTALSIRGLDNTYAGGYSTTAGSETRVNVDTSSNGGITAIEGSTTSLSTSITNVNDAPTLGDGSLSAVNEDTSSPSGETVSTIFSGQFSDIDPSSSFGGIAIVANSANAGTEGAWQYSTNSGSNWFDIGTVADNSTALALSASTLIRFVPVDDFQGAPTALSVRGLDNTYAGGYSTTAGSETRVNVDTSTNGGSTAIEGSTTSLSTSITNVNDAPTLGDGSLSAVNEDTSSPSGETVSTIFSGQFSDIDPSSSFGGIAVVANSANSGTEGAWQYSTNSGSNWFDIGTVADNSAALALSASTLIRFVPVADFQGTPTALSVRGLDNTYSSGYSTTAGSETRVNVDTSSNGGTTAIEGSTTSLSTSITNVNDAPTLGDGSLSAVNEDTSSPSGETVSTIFSGQFSDIDPSSSFGGIAVVANSANSGTEGAWQYSTNSGSNWFDIGTVADNSTALALSASTLIRFVPVDDFQGTPTALSVRGLDNTYASGYSTTAGSEVRVNVDTSTNGGSTAIEGSTTTLSTSITNINDAPSISTPSAAPTYTENFSAQVIDAGATISDIDSSNLDSGTLTVSISANGTANDELSIKAGNGVSTSGNDVIVSSTVVGTYSGGTGGTDLVITWNTNSTPSNAQMVMRQVAYRNTSDGPGSSVTVEFTLTDGDSGTSNTAQQTVNITQTNDSPTLSNGTLAAINEDTADPSGQSIATIYSGNFSDPDAGASFVGVAITNNLANAVTEGVWEYTTNGGTNWASLADVASNNLVLSVNTVIRFVPVSNFEGTPGKLELRALDDTWPSGFSDSIPAGTRVYTNTGGAGNGSSMSGSSTDLTTSITAVNDAPTLGDGTLSAVNEDTSAPSGETVSTIFSGQFSDVDSGSSFGGIAVVANSANPGTEGAWQYSTDSGSNWSNIGTVADNSTALALSASTLIRFVPISNFNGTPTSLSVRALDNTYAAGFSSTGVSENRVTVDTSSNGGSTAIEGSTTTLSTSITAQNDAPTASNNTISTHADDTYTFTANDFNFSDVDTGDSLASIEITSLESNGSLELSGVAVTLNQVITVANINSGNLTFVPGSNASGSGYDSFGFSVNDGTTDSAASYTLTVDIAAPITGTTGNDLISGTSSKDIIIGGYGGDTIDGGAGNDTIYADNVAFTSSSVTGLSAWYDANDLNSITKSGTNVSQWNDKSGQNNHATQSGTDNQKPDYVVRNGIGSMQFNDGLGTYFAANGAASIANSAHTVFILMEAGSPFSNTTSYYLSFNEAGSGTSELWGLDRNSGNLIYTDSDGSTTIASGSHYNDYTFLTVAFDNSSLDPYLDGATLSSIGDAELGGSTTRFSIGQEWDNTTASNFYDGYIYEVMLVDHKVSSAERSIAEEYLSYKSGIALSGLSFGTDILTGGPGADTFVWANASYSLSPNRDQITDFSGSIGGQNDKIDISTLTPNSIVIAGNTSYSSTSYELVWLDSGAHTIIGVDYDADFLSNWHIQLNNFTASNLSSADFIFGNVTGSGGADTINLGNAGYTAYGEAGNDIITGGTGNDTIEGNAGNDTLVGGAGTDTLSYQNSSSGVIINMGTGTAASGDAAGDSFSGFENLTGSAHIDSLTGDDNANVINGLGGIDTIRPEGGADTIDGGEGNDYVTYNTSASAVTINLTTGLGSGGDAAGDSYTNIENIIGSAYDDTLTGSSGNNIIYGGNGNDTIYGASGGTDTLDGEGGTGDILSYVNSSSVVNLNFISGSHSGAAANETISGFEIITGSAYGDTILADNSGMTLNGGDGVDRLSGGSGNDTLDGGLGSDFFLYGGDGDDVLVFDFADLLAGGSGGIALRYDGGNSVNDMDVLRLDDASESLNMASVNRVEVVNIEKIDFASTNNSLSIDSNQLVYLTDTDRNLFVDGDDDDSVTLNNTTGTWTNNGLGASYAGYVEYSANSSGSTVTIQVQQAVTDVTIV